VKAHGFSTVFIDGDCLAVVYDDEVKWYSFIDGDVQCVRVCITL
jgi:hypothetical protein